MPPAITRITHILGSLEYAGLQRTVLALVRALPQYGHTVIFSSPDQGPLYPEFAATCQMIPCPYLRGGVMRALMHMPRLATALRQAAPDVVLAHLFGNHVLVSLSAWRAGIPAVYAISANNPVHYARSRWKPLLLAQLGRPFCRGEIAVSEAVAATLREDLRLPARRVHVIPNGCAVAEIATRADSGRTARRSDPGPRLLMVAWLGRAKDHHTAVRAVAELRRMGWNAQLSLAGRVGRQERLTALQALASELGVADSVHFLGLRDDVPELMGASDVVIHATHSEGLPIAVLEAFASRTPVVATDIPPCREALDGGRCGILVPPGDPLAIARGVESLLRRDDLRRAVVDAAFERVSTRYDARQMATAYAALIDDAAHR